MNEFTVYPAIDLRAGQVVRLVQGDPQRQTVYDTDPAQVAGRWIEAGATWLHVVNLDGALAAEGGDPANNLAALEAILAAAGGRANVQFGGGLRTLADVERVLSLGVRRAILGTAAIESPALLCRLLGRFGPERIAVGIDAHRQQVRIRGWLQATDVDPIVLGCELGRRGVSTAIYTNIARDGTGDGTDVKAARRLAQETGLSVIASGGAASLDDLRRARAAGLSGIVVGRALYSGEIDLREALQC